MVTNQNLIVEAVAKYARRETLSEEDKLILEKWWSESQKNRFLAEVFRDAEVLKAQLAMDRKRSAKIWSEISQLIDEADEKEGIIRYVPLMRRRWMKVAMSAAAAAFLFLGGYLVFFRGSKVSPAAIVTTVKPKKPSTAHTDGSAMSDSSTMLVRRDGTRIDVDRETVGAVLEELAKSVLRKLAMNSIGYDQAGNKQSMLPALYISAKHKPYTVRMPDGSLARLSPGSAFEMNFGEGRREVRLKGKGRVFFNIERDAGRPFVVRAPNGAVIDVLGTSFQVETSAVNPETSIQLLQGKLRVTNDKGSVILSKPFQTAVIGEGLPQVCSGKDSGGLADWIRESAFFHFDNTGFSEVMRQVAAWYGCRIVITEPIHGMPIISRLPRSLSIDRILAVIRQVETGYVSLEKKDDVIFLSPWEKSKPTTKGL